MFPFLSCRSIAVRMSILLPLLVVVGLSFGGCRYGHNRLYDFMDQFDLAVGVTGPNRETGLMPPALGAHVEAMEIFKLGAIFFGGATAQMDGRALYAGPEVRFRASVPLYEWLVIEQDLEQGAGNYFKEPYTVWTHEMAEGSWLEAPKANYVYDDYRYDRQRRKMTEGMIIFHRGWTHWEDITAEVGVCDPFLTHLGLYLRVGYDPSQTFDFLIGLAGMDLYGDDLSPMAFDDMLGHEMTH